MVRLITAQYILDGQVPHDQLALPLAAWRQAIGRYRHAAAKRW
jgi:hypothetical protein